MTLKCIPAWRRHVSLVLVSALLPALAAAGDVQVPLDPAVRTGRLPNGLTYYVRKNLKPEKRVELRLAVNSGSVQEDDDQLGLAHFVEHMCFNGTEHFPKNDLIHYLQSVGAAFGPDINGYTSFDETVYMLTVPSDNPDTLAKGLQIMTDWAHRVSFDPAEVDKERGVITEEWRLGRGPDQRMRDQYLPILFRASKYARRLPIGTKESIEGSSHDALKRFYRDWYRPDNLAFIAVGDVDPDRMVAAIEAGFSAIPAPAQPRAKEAASVPDHDEPLYAIVSDRENPMSVLQLVFKTTPRDYTSSSGFQRRFAERLFVQMLNQRLSEIVQQPDPPFIRASAGYGKFWVRARDAFMLTALVPENGFERALSAALTETERVQRFGFTAPELERAKRSLLRGLEQAYNERDKTPSYQLARSLVAHFLASEPDPGAEFEYHFGSEHLGEIGLPEVNRLAAEWIRPKNQVVIASCVEKEGVKLPTEVELRAVGRQVASGRIAPYQEAQLANSLLPKAPAPGKIVSEKLIAEIGATELMLSNGVRVVLRPTDFQNDQILVSAYRPGGQSLFPDDYHVSAQLASGYAAESGVGEFSRIDLQKMLAGKRVSVQVQILPYYDGVSGGCAVGDLETLFQLIHLGFTQPRRDEVAYQSLVSRQKAALENRLANPTYAFLDDARKARFSHHPRCFGVLPTEADWNTVTLDKVMEVRRSRFEDADGFTFFLVGSFTLEGIKPLLETYLASLPARSGSHAWRDLGLRTAAGPVDQAFHRGSDPKSLAILALERAMPFDRDEAHRLWSLGNILKRAYVDKLREEMSGVYGFNVSITAQKVPYEHVSFDLVLPCAPENVQKLTEAAYAEIRRIQTAGPTTEEIQKEVETQRRTAEKNAKENRAWLRDLEKIYREGEGYGRLAHPEELIALVTAPEIQRVAQAYLRTEDCLRYVLYPQPK